MSNEKNIRIVKGGERFIGSQDKDVRVTPLITTEQREYVEGDRNLSLSLVEQFNDERDYCSRYRLYGKINMVYNNIITGSSSDNTVIESMYFMPDYYGCPPAGSLLPYAGLPCLGTPPSMAFDMIPPKRYWGNTTTYSDVTSHHDNWVSYITYVYSHDNSYSMRYYYGGDYTSGHITFTPDDGIPFISELVNLNGSEHLQFTCAVPHGLTKDVYFELQSGATTTTLHHRIALPSHTTTVIDGKPHSFGDGTVGSEEYIFNVRVDTTVVGFEPTSMGTFKRILNIDRKNDTRSEYYIHKHKVITKYNDITIDRTGFEDEIFKRSGRIFKARHTPNNIKKTVIRQEMNSFAWNCDVDIDREEYYDNHNRPITELYLTIIQANKNNMWRYDAPPDGTPSSPMGYGWDWNFRSIGEVDPYVNVNTNPTLISQTNTTGINEPSIGSVMRGAFVEWNKYDLEERTLSNISHSLEFNQAVFSTDGSIYRYKPHYKIKLRTFSKDIVYDSDLNESPQYAQYLISENAHRWRPINPIGFYEEGVGVTYPYLNDSHYPYRDVKFMIEPIRVGSEFSGTGRVIMTQQIGDYCE
jgi:hypothetical protein